MNELIPRSDDSTAPVAIRKTELKPVKATDEPGLWRKFADFVRQNIGLKPLDLAERWAEAEVASREIDNQIKLLKAKQEFERVQAEIRRQNLAAHGQLEKAKAEAAEIRSKARNNNAEVRIQEVAARAIERRGESPDEAMQRLQQIVEKIRALGGDVEIEPIDGEFGQDQDDQQAAE